MKVGIIGGGIIGLSCAYYLTQDGHDVTILDRGDFASGCSWGNAGMIVPSHLVPLAAPGMIAKGIRWMFNSTSPFYVRPRFDADLIRWGITFYRHANEAHVREAAPALRDLSLFSKGLFQTLASKLPPFGYEERGLIMLYQSAATEKEEGETAGIANRHGIEARVLSPAEVQSLEPEVEVKVRGGVYFPGDAHLIPQQFMSRLTGALRSAGVRFVPSADVIRFTLLPGRLDQIHTADREYAFDHIVVAAGAWSSSLAARVGLRLPIQSGKGYSFMMENLPSNIRVPSILLEGRVAVTPMGNSLRLGGTMEITGIDHSVSMSRVKGVADTVPRYYPGIRPPVPPVDGVWHGLRPCSPDGLPYIGPVPGISNLTLASGHAMMGLSLAPGTGRIVSDLIAGRTPPVSIRAFRPERFDRSRRSRF